MGGEEAFGFPPFVGPVDELLVREGAQGAARLCVANIDGASGEHQQRTCFTNFKPYYRPVPHINITGHKGTRSDARGNDSDLVTQTLNG